MSHPLLRRAAIAASACFASLAAIASAQTTDFLAPVSFPVGTAPRCVAAGDLNGDALPDLVSGNGLSHSLSILLNTGSGFTAGAPATIASGGNGPRDLALAFLNADAALDLAVANLDGDSVSVFLGVGDGTFLPPTTFPVGDGPTGLAAGDLDGDFDFDLAVSETGSFFVAGGVRILTNDGAGGFGSSAVLPTAGSFQDVRIADLDGVLGSDLVASDQGLGFPATSPAIRVWLSAGGGSFGAPAAVAVGSNPAGFDLFDVDGDGDRDALVTRFFFPGSIAVLLGDGAGGFGPPTTVSSGFSGPIAVVGADFGEDGDGDLVAADLLGGNLRFLFDYPAGFTAASSLASGAQPIALAVADFNADATPDVAVANQGSNAIAVHTAIPRPLAQAFGAGCTGTGGIVPVISAASSPTLGNSAFTVDLSSALPFTAAFVLLSTFEGTIPLPATTCSILVGIPFIEFALMTDGSGQASLPIPIPPPAPGLDGLNFYTQYAVVDPQGAYLGQGAFSGGLRLKIGY